MKYNKKFTDQVKDAKVAYLDAGGVMHVLHDELETVKKKGYLCLDISDKGLKCHGGYPLISKDETATLKIVDGVIKCMEGSRYLTPVLKGIYEELLTLNQ